MSEMKFKDDLIKHLMGVLFKIDPKKLAKVMKRHEIRATDYSFSIFRSGKVRTTIRWPWQRHDPNAKYRESPRADMQTEHEFAGDDYDCSICGEGRAHYLHGKPQCYGA